MKRVELAEVIIQQAADILAQGGLVAFPTETVYGLGADARRSDAVRRIFEAKGRPSFNPLIVHVAGLDEAMGIGEFDELSLQLARAFWPGPLTIVVPLRVEAGISPLVTAGLETIALRVPAHPIAQALLKKSGLAIAAPSANSSGRISPTTSGHVEADIGRKVDFIVEGGATDRGIESTIVMVKNSDQLTGSEISADGKATVIMLRPGTVTLEQLAAVSGVEVVRSEQAVSEDGGGDASLVAPVAPGALLRHYAPRARVRLNALDVRRGEGVLGFGDEQLFQNEAMQQRNLTKNITVSFYNLSESGDLLEAAQRLFAGLHMMDEWGVEGIAVRPIPDEGVGVAINDRLRRAAAGSGGLERSKKA